MSEGRRQQHRAPGRNTWARRLVTLGVVLLVFALGIAIGQALNDGPPPPSTETYTRTLETLTQKSGATGP